MPSTRLVVLLGLSLATPACLPAVAIAAPVSSQFVLDGAVVTPGTYDLATLSALPPTTQTVT